LWKYTDAPKSTNETGKKLLNMNFDNGLGIPVNFNSALHLGHIMEVSLKDTLELEPITFTN
jgi:hypothetical protein